MLTSARIRSGFASRARESASFPSETTVRVTSSALNVISTALWMVTESSARSRDLGTFVGLRADAGQGAFHLYPSLPRQASFRNSSGAAARESAGELRPPRPTGADRARRTAVGGCPR